MSLMIKDACQRKLKGCPQGSTSGSSLFDSIDLALFAKVNEQLVSIISSSYGLACTSINTLDPSPNMNNSKSSEFAA